jgi:hypothetical protein
MKYLVPKIKVIWGKYILLSLIPSVKVLKGLNGCLYAKFRVPPSPQNK